jgi:alpha-L-rhamnosidase
MEMNPSQDTGSAKWIWTPERTKRPTHFVYFRKEVTLNKSGMGIIHCAADSKYRLWVNGVYIGFGPARGNAKNPYYDCYRVKLHPGRNTFAFLVQYYTDRCAIFDSRHGGLICQVSVGNNSIVVTDKSWASLSSRAHGPMPGWIFPEKFDARHEPQGWERPGYSETGWKNAKEVSTQLD